MRGFFEIGIYHTKTSSNIGMLWRSAYQLGASGVFTIGKRCPYQASDTTKAFRHVPMREYLNFDEFLTLRPKGSKLVGIETGGKSLTKFWHPDQAIYLLGAEDSGLPSDIVKKCDNLISIEAVRIRSYNVAVAGSIVMYHRYSTKSLNQ